MSWPAECPVCRQPLRWSYLLRTMWSRWPCRRCGSVLGVDRKRRFLSLLPVVFLALPVSAYLARHGWGDFIAVPVVAIIWVPLFLLLDRAAVVERCGFRRKQCGYNLQGQTVPRCPECGREFDAGERTFMETGAYSQMPSRRGGHSRVALVLVVIAFGLTLLAVGITRFRVVKARAARRQALATQPAAGAWNRRAGPQPSEVGEGQTTPPATSDEPNSPSEPP